MTRELSERLRLIVVTDAALAGPRGILEVVRAALRGGAPAIQLRDKAAGAREMTELARRLVAETRPAGALLFVNDRLDVAMAAGADGAHLGDDDLPLAAARSIAPPGFLLGRSVDTPALARIAAAEGADYVGVGPVFATSTKPDAGAAVGLERIRAVASSCELPVVGIGGITAANAGAVVAGGACGVAVVSEVMAAPDPSEAVAGILSIFDSPGRAAPS